MAANRTKAQIAQGYKERGIMQPKVKLEGEELQRHLRQSSKKFAHKNTGRLKTRANQKRHAMAN